MNGQAQLVKSPWFFIRNVLPIVFGPEVDWSVRAAKFDFVIRGKNTNRVENGPVPVGTWVVDYPMRPGRHEKVETVFIGIQVGGVCVGIRRFEAKGRFSKNWITT